MIRRLIASLILLSLSFPALSDLMRYELRVDGLACPYCAYGIEKKIKALEGVNKDSLEIKLNKGLVIFEADTDSPLTEQSMKTLINDAGFTLRQYKVLSINSREKPE